MRFALLVRVTWTLEHVEELTMSTAFETRELLPEDLLTMPDGSSFELVDGNLVELNMSTTSSWVAGNLLVELSLFVRQHDLGWVFPEGTSYQCYRDAPRKVRRPDDSFIRKGRFSNEQLPDGHITISPDLAVEVVSPHDAVYELEVKVREYLNTGVRLVWVLHPENRSAYVHRADGTTSWLSPASELDGEDVLPGFRCPLERLFPPVSVQT
jgi:Uma2 family endonuclease